MSSDRHGLPDRRSAEICMFEHGGCRYRATFGRFRDGGLGEIFLDCGKMNSTLQHADNSAVLVSLLLQHGVPATIIRRSISGPIGTALDLWLGRSM
jgi:hypothetical protein